MFMTVERRQPDRGMPRVPSEKPDTCPVCETPYESVSEHSDGLIVGLDANEQFRRVCFEPRAIDGDAYVQFYHHTHEQAETDCTAESRT